MESGVPQKKCDVSVGNCTDNDRRLSVEFLSKRSSDNSLLKHEIPKDINSKEENVISTGEVFFVDFYKIL